MPSQVTGTSSIDGTFRTLIPLVDSRLNESTISRVAAATVKLISLSSIKYNDLGITAIGHLEQTEFVK